MVTLFPPADTEKNMGVYERQKDPEIFHMIVIIGLIFNALISIFVVLYWLNLL